MPNEKSIFDCAVHGFTERQERCRSVKFYEGVHVIPLRCALLTQSALLT